jgi:hypothetical protein
MTRQQQAWNVPPSELLERAPRPELAESALPPLPNMALAATPPATAAVPKVFSLDKPPQNVPAKRDDALLQTSAQVPQKPEVPIVITQQASTPIDPDTTRQIVTGLVGASTTLSSIDIDSDDNNNEAPPTPAPIDPGVIATAAVKNPKAAGPAPAKPPQTETIPSFPPIEILPQQNVEGSEQRSIALQIPKAAICRSVEGRGNFRAMPPEKIVPGSALLVYWELDGLTRRKSDQNAQLSATLELVRADRDQILASVRENLEKSGDLPPEGDFAAMRWQIPGDLAPGDYRIRITTVDLNGKSTDQSDVDVTVVPAPKSATAE